MPEDRARVGSRSHGGLQLRHVQGDARHQGRPSARTHRAQAARRRDDRRPDGDLGRALLAGELGDAALPEPGLRGRAARRASVARLLPAAGRRGRQALRRATGPGRKRHRARDDADREVRAVRRVNAAARGDARRIPERRAPADSRRAGRLPRDGGEVGRLERGLPVSLARIPVVRARHGRRDSLSRQLAAGADAVGRRRRGASGRRRLVDRSRLEPSRRDLGRDRRVRSAGGRRQRDLVQRLYGPVRSSGQLHRRHRDRRRGAGDAESDGLDRRPVLRADPGR